MNKENAEQWHVCGLMVQCKPHQIDNVQVALLALTQTDVAGVDRAKGRLVTVMESHDQHTLLERIEQAREIEGVIVVSLVYHEQDIAH